VRTITIHVSESVYREFQEVARREDRTAAELIRESMTLYLRDRSARGASVLELAPLSLGRVKRPLTRNTHLAGEMLDDLRR
jgi:predicted transcriptional regulator